MNDSFESLPPTHTVATPIASTVWLKSVMGRSKRDSVYCANTTELVALNLMVGRLNAAQYVSHQRIYVRKEYSSDSKGSWHKESWAWIGLL